MPVALTTLRATIASTLSNNSVYQTFSYPPSTPIANSVVVVPNDPWIVPSNNSQSTIAPLGRFRIMMLVPLIDNQGNLVGMEDVVVAVYNKLAAATYLLNISSVSAPTVLNAPTGDLLQSDMTIEVLTTWS